MAKEDEVGGLDGMLSQDDINAALAAANGSPPPPTQVHPSVVTSSPLPEELPLSQDEIDAAMAGMVEEPPKVQAPAPPPPPKPADTRVDAAGNPFDEIAAAMADAIAEEKQAVAAPKPPPPGSRDLDMPDFTGSPRKLDQGGKIELLGDVELNVKIELGRTRMFVEDVLNLDEGSVVELDKLAGDPVDVLVNDRLVARGEVLVLNDNFCVRVNEIISQAGTPVRS